MTNHSSNQQSSLKASVKWQEMGQEVVKELKYFCLCPSLPTNEFLTRKKGQGKIKEAKQVGRELFLEDHFPTN